MGFKYLILLSALLVVSEGFYTTKSIKISNLLLKVKTYNINLVYFENKDPSSESVEIHIDQNDNIEFPDFFSVKISDLTSESVVFEKIPKGPKYPLGDGNVYTINLQRKLEKLNTVNNQQVNLE